MISDETLDEWLELGSNNKFIPKLIQALRAERKARKLLMKALEGSCHNMIEDRGHSCRRVKNKCDACTALADAKELVGSDDG